MQPKLIKSILSRKITAWADSVQAEDLKAADAIRNGAIVMGGAIASMLTNEKVNDYDVYFSNKEDAKTVISYYIRKFQALQKAKHKNTEKDIDTPIYLKENSDPVGFSTIIKSSGVFDANQEKAYRYFETEEESKVIEYFGNVDENSAALTAFKDDINNPKTGEQILDEVIKESNEAKGSFRPVFITENAITLSDEIQIVTRFYGTPEEIIEYYDYEHCKMWYDFKKSYLHLTVDAMEALMNKRLVYSGSKFPICSLFRIKKFLNRGFTINAGQILKMAMQINELNLNDIRVLKDQLIGVDHAYFVELLGELKKHQDDIKQDNVDRTYLVQLIDKYF